MPKVGLPCYREMGQYLFSTTMNCILLWLGLSQGNKTFKCPSQSSHSTFKYVFNCVIPGRLPFRICHCLIPTHLHMICPIRAQLPTAGLWAARLEQLDAVTEHAAIFSITSTPHGAALLQEGQGLVQYSSNTAICFPFSVRRISVRGTYCKWLYSLGKNAVALGSSEHQKEPTGGTNPSLIIQWIEITPS